MYTYSIIILKIARKVNRNVDFPGFSKSFIRLSANLHRKLRCIQSITLPFKKQCKIHIWWKILFIRPFNSIINGAILVSRKKTYRRICRGWIGISVESAGGNRGWTGCIYRIGIVRSFTLSKTIGKCGRHMSSAEKAVLQSLNSWMVPWSGSETADYLLPKKVRIKSWTDGAAGIFAWWILKRSGAQEADLLKV